MEKKLEVNKEQKHLPMIVKVFDFPKIHHFGNMFGRRMMAALSESDDISVFDRVFVQAIPKETEIMKTEEESLVALVDERPDSRAEEKLMS